MIFIWGKKYVYRHLGYVGDYCPMCRGARPFSVRRVGLAGHIYYITLSQGELLGHERTCLDCGIALDAEPANYACLYQERASLPVLLQKTFPNHAQAFAGRMELVEKLKTTPALLTREERSGLLRQPFVLLSPKVEAHYAKLQFDLPFLLTVGAVIIVLPMLLAFAERMVPPGATADKVIFGLIFLAVGLIGWQLIATGPRFLRKKVLPPLVKSLRPLKPSQIELQVILNELKQHKHKMGSKLKLKVLTDALRGR